MDFGFSEEQELLQASAREFLRAEAPPSFARAMMDDPVGITEKVWRALADLGWLGLVVPEQQGGSGLGYFDMAILLQECGRVVLPGPLMSTLALATPAVLAAATPEQKAALLPGLAAGGVRATLALAEAPGLWREDAVATSIARRAGGWSVSGQKRFVPDARSADRLLVVGKIDGRAAIALVPRDAHGLRIEAMHTIDRTRKLDVVSLDGVAIEADAVLGGGPLADGTLARLVDIARVMTAAEMCGAADAALMMSVDYVKIRTQFDRPIATFQAVQHKLADMKVALENSRSLVYYAAWALDTKAADGSRAAAMAKAYASDACVKVVADAIQVHGGIGFTWEHDLHLYFKRVKSGELTYGDAADNREAVADELEL